MECPSCKSPLKQVKFHGVPVDICRKCKGIWFDNRGEMKGCVDFLQKKSENVPYAKIELQQQVLTTSTLTGISKRCPRCGETMREFNYAYDSNIILDRCPGCGGIWSDGREIYKVAAHVKGNPRLDKLGRSIVEDSKEKQTIYELSDFGKEMSRNASWLIMPKIIFPMGDDIGTAIFPGVVVSIIAVNLLVFLYQAFYISDPASFFQDLGTVPSVITSGTGYFSIITSMFLHANILHLIGNMFFLWIFGDNVEESLGHLRFLLFYLTVGIFADLIHISMSIQSTVPAIGSSGAVAGLMGAYLILYPQAKINTFIIYRVIGVPAYLYLGGWIMLQIINGSISAFSEADVHIAWFAHIGGFFGGMIFIWIYQKLRKSKRMQSKTLS